MSCVHIKLYYIFTPFIFKKYQYLHIKYKQFQRNLNKKKTKADKFLLW